MNLQLTKRKLLLMFVVFITSYLAYSFYDRKLATTNIALVNYQGFQAARLIDANDSSWVTVDQVDKDSIGEFASYDVIYVFGRGLSLNDDQLRALRNAGKAGSKLVVEASTNPALDVTNVNIDDLQQIQDYFKYGGEFNYKQLLRYSRVVLNGKGYGVQLPEQPLEISSDVLFHKDEARLFTEVDQYQSYYETLPGYVLGAKKVALLTSVPGPFNANRDHLDSLIDRLEQAGMQVFPVASYTRRLAFLKQIQPDAVIMMPHGRMQLGAGDQTIAWLKQVNVPLLAPVSVFERYDDWLKNPQGYSSNLLTMNVVLPELDGATVPYAINAQFNDENNLEIFKAIPKRQNSFVSILQQWFDLKGLNNHDKRLAIVYFRGPGKNAMVAGNMEVASSLYATLKRLKLQGYNLAGLPSDYKQFKQDLDRQGVVMAPYASGLVEQFMTDGNPALISAKLYSQWCQTLLNEGLCAKVEEKYGPAPGDFLVTEDKSHIAVARLQYGNVVLVPQPLPGLGEDTFKLVHGTDEAPPHSYMAPYLWIREGFEADAIMHFGTHGSLEFTPGKQVALSGYDWADALIGDTPHFYVYTMSNVGEAIIAKRRTYATILSHLTPPFKESALYSELKQLSDALANYQASQGSVQRQTAVDINALIKAVELDVDLQLPSNYDQLSVDQWQQQVLSPVSQWLETLAQSKITEGLYTLGTAFTGGQADRTATQMAVDALLQSYRQLGEYQSVNARSDAELRVEAVGWINQVLAGADSDLLAASLIDNALIERTAFWRANNKTMSQSDIIKGFIAMSGKSKRQQGEQLSDEQLMALTAKAMSDSASLEFLKGLDNDQAFSHVVKALDPEMAARAKVLAKVIPAIGKSLVQLDKPDVRKLVIAMQVPRIKDQVMSWLANDDLAALVAQQKEQILNQVRTQLVAQLGLVGPLLVGQSTDWNSLTNELALLNDFSAKYTNNTQLSVLMRDDIKAQLDISVEEFEVSVAAATRRIGKVLAEARIAEEQLAVSVEMFTQALTQVQQYKTHLVKGAELEQLAMVNALSGGYTEPSSGGDPILNPSALPTGRNLYSIDAEKTPSVAAWKTGKELANTLLETHLASTGSYPKKVSFTLWPSEFIHTQGATVAQILYLLGVEPVRDPFSRVTNLRLIEADTLGRPRIDVVVQSAGQLRDIAASRLALIERAVKIAAQANDQAIENYVSKGVADAERYMLAKGVAPAKAREDAYRRSFGGVNGAYGTAIMAQVEQGDSWQDTSEVAQQYLNNMGAVYGDSETWGEYQPHLFAAALQNTEIVIQPRSSNTWGALSLDHVYEFMGGLNLAVKEVTGSDPAAYFNDFRNPGKSQVQSLNTAIWQEMRTTLLNPTYIGDLMKGEASSAETFAETFRNTYGWNVMKESAIDDSVWNQLHDVYIEDRHALGLRKFFEQQNPYALQEMTGVMLETARKGLWQASDSQLEKIATIHAQLVSEHQAGCGNFTCGNEALQAYIGEQLTEATLIEQYTQQLNAAQRVDVASSGVVLAKESEPTGEQAEKTESQLTPPATSNEHSMPWHYLIGLLFALLIAGVVIRGKRARH